MPHTPRIGIQLGPDDPFWVQVREVMWERAGLHSIELVELTIQGSQRLSRDEQLDVVEDLVVQEIDVLISNDYPANLLAGILERGGRAAELRARLGRGFAVAPVVHDANDYSSRSAPSPRGGRLRRAGRGPAGRARAPR